MIVERPFKKGATFVNFGSTQSRRGAGQTGNHFGHAGTHGLPVDHRSANIIEHSHQAVFKLRQTCRIGLAIEFDVNEGFLLRVARTLFGHRGLQLLRRIASGAKRGMDQLRQSIA